jgi:hypothetical protein
MIQKKIDDCTDAELRTFANTNLGLAAKANIGRGNLLAKMRQVWQPDWINIEDEDEAALAVEYAEEANAERTVANIRSLRGGSSKNDPLVRVTFAMTEDAGGDRAIFASVNNVGMLVPRGEEIQLPYRYFIALKNAVVTTYTMDTETFENIPRDVPAYAFSVVALPTEEEMQGWHKQEHESQYPPGKSPDLDQTMKDTQRARAQEQALRASQAQQQSQYLGR